MHAVGAWTSAATSGNDGVGKRENKEMRWDDFRRSENVEDDREGGGGFGIPVGRGGLGIGTVIVLGLLGWAFGIDPSVLIGGAEIISNSGSSYQQPSTPPARRTGTPSDRTGDFVAAVLGRHPQADPRQKGSVH